MATRTANYEGSLPDLIRSNKKAYTAPEIAELLGISANTLFTWAAKGRIPCIRIGSTVRFDPGAVASWLESKSA